MTRTESNVPIRRQSRLSSLVVLLAAMVSTSTMATAQDTPPTRVLRSAAALGRAPIGVTKARISSDRIYRAYKVTYGPTHDPAPSATRTPTGFTKVRISSDRIYRAYKVTYGPTNDPAPSGCRGSNGEAPTLTRSESADGSTLTLELRASPARGAILLFGASASPVDLTTVGAPGCDLLVQPAIALPARTDGSGRAVLQLALARTDTTVAVQAVVFDPAANAAGVTLSRAIELAGGD